MMMTKMMITTMMMMMMMMYVMARKPKARVSSALLADFDAPCHKFQPAQQSGDYAYTHITIIHSTKKPL